MSREKLKREIEEISSSPYFSSDAEDSTRKHKSRKHKKHKKSSRSHRSRRESRRHSSSSRRRSRSRSRSRPRKLEASRSRNDKRRRSVEPEAHSSFISEVLRNPKKILSKNEEFKLLDSVTKSLKKKQKELEEGEIISDEGSFTPKALPSQPPKADPKPKVEETRVVIEKIPLPSADVEAGKPKKKSVLELPMPPVIIDHRTTPDFKPEQFKFRENHFKEIRSQLDLNPVVISPCENFEKHPMKQRARPKILNRPEPIEEFKDRRFDSFQITQQIGEGTYGKVYKAKDLITKQIVAMKYVRMEKESEGFPITGLREVKILRSLHHKNVVKLREIVSRDEEGARRKDFGTYLVFEYMNHDLMGLLKNSSMVFNENSIYLIMKQLLEGLSYCHERHILHRDLKCSNILINNNGEVKLADFGLGRQWFSDRPYTNKVISLWYRPIELLLGEASYGTPIDVWSLGCIFGEMFQRRTIFAFGTEIEMIHAIFNLCGTPSIQLWPEVKSLPNYATLKPKLCRRIIRDTFVNIFPNLALDLFDKMLILNPAKRITAAEALKSNWIEFMSQKKNLEPLKLPSEQDCHEMLAKTQRKKPKEIVLSSKLTKVSSKWNLRG